MGITDTSGEVMRWIPRLREFTFDIKYKKGNHNTEAYALSRLQSLGHTTVALDDDITAYPDDASLTQ